MGKRRPKQADHVEQVQLGGEAQPERYVRRPPALNVLPPKWEAKSGVPKTRAECPTERPCPYVRCRHHLYLKLSEDREGRPRDGRRAPTIFWPPSAVSCSLDVADRGEELSCQEIGSLLGICDEAARNILNRALAKIRASGVDADELRRFLEGERSRRVERTGVQSVPREA